MRRILQVVALVSLLFAAVNAFGQTFNGQIGGIVNDPSKALIPGATITLTNTGTGVVTTQITDESGAYSFANVPPGTYKATAALPGFNTSVFNDVGVGTAAQVRLNFTLQIGEVSSQVEVSVSAQQLLTESSATIGEVLQAERAVNLPIVNQDVLELVRIMPGMRVDPFGDAFSTFTDGTVGDIVLQNPTPGKMGNAPFTLEAPGKWRFDANISKSFRLSESKSLQIRVDMENVMNHADVGDSQPITGQAINTDGIIFGQISSKGGNGSGAAPRSFQGQLRFTF